MEGIAVRDIHSFQNILGKGEIGVMNSKTEQLDKYSFWENDEFSNVDLKKYISGASSFFKVKTNRIIEYSNLLINEKDFCIAMPSYAFLHTNNQKEMEEEILGSGLKKI